jgi:hypothetical protein
MKNGIQLLKLILSIQSRDLLIYLFRENGGFGLLAFHNHSLFQILKTVFPGEFITDN